MAEMSERRRAHRVEAQLKLRVQTPDASKAEASATLETINISTSGVYFRSEHYIAPMTKLGMAIELAVPGPDPAQPDLALIQCEGLVVRTSPEVDTASEDPYEVAVFFTSMEPDGIRILEDHIAYLMTQA